MVNTKRQAPVLTSTLPVLMEAIADPRSSAAKVADVVSRDHGLAARVLGLANSAQYGLARQVSRLDMAIGLVGSSMVQTLAIANATALLDRHGCVGDRQHHALEVAAAARLLAPFAGAPGSDAFAAGLLHDVGEILLLQAHPTEYIRFLEEPLSHHATQIDLEQTMFGTDHATLGSEHLFEWRVPDVISDAVADHGEPTSAMTEVALAVAAADELVDDDPNRRIALRMLGISEAVLDDLKERLRDDAEALRAQLVG